MAEFIITGSKDEYKAAEQTFSIYLNTPCFNMEAWSDGDFAKFKRDGNKITIYLSKNRHVAERFFGIVFSDPTGRYEQTKWSSVQSGQTYMFDSEESTFERGYTPEEYTVKQLQGPKLDRLYIGGELIKKPLIYTTEIKVYGGDCIAYIRGINKFRVLSDNTAIPEQMVPFDSGIFAEIKPSESCQVDERGRTFNINTLTITSNGRPFSDNDEYFYVVSIGHSDTPRFYCEVRVEFKEKEGAGNATLDVDKDGLVFEYTGGTKIVNINLGNAEDCDWSVDEDTLPEWIEVVRYPLSIGVVCQPITSLDDNQENRTATIQLIVNGQSLDCQVTQKPLSGKEIDVSSDSLVCEANATEVILTATTYGVELQSSADVMCQEIGRTNLAISYLVTLKISKPNNLAGPNPISFTLKTIDGKSEKEITVIQLGKSSDKELLSVVNITNKGTTSTVKIRIPHDNIPIAYASANWCETVSTTKSDDESDDIRDIYEIVYKIKDGEDNVFGITRKCKIVFTDANATENTVNCLATSTIDNDGKYIKIEEL